MGNISSHVPAVTLTFALMTGCGALPVQDDLKPVKKLPTEPVEKSAFSCSQAPMQSASLSQKLNHALSATVVIGEPKGSHGSGFIIDSSGFIVTNNHVIEGDYKAGKTTFDITFYNADKKDNLGKKVKATFVGRDKENDIAVLKVAYDKTLPCLQFEVDKNSYLGATTYAIGHPLRLPFSISKGIVSNLNRVETGVHFNVIQTDITLNVGNSGGPLVTEDMKVLGINTAIYGEKDSGVGYDLALAMPALDIMRTVNDLIRFGEVKRGWIGAKASNIDGALKEKLGIESGVAIFGQPKVGSPADIAGLRKDDIIISADVKPIDDTVDFRRAIVNKRPNDNVVFEVLRMKNIINISLTLGHEELYKQNVEKQTSANSNQSKEYFVKNIPVPARP